MGKRISIPYTRTGDDACTGLANGERISKGSGLIKAIGAVDELNAKLGTLRHYTKAHHLCIIIKDIQHKLFDLGADLASQAGKRITHDDVEQIEEYIRLLNGNLNPLDEFILPGGSLLSCIAHEARTICRRAECEIIAAGSVRCWRDLVAYTNRLSSFLFVIARVYNQEDDTLDTYWEPKEKNR